MTDFYFHYDEKVPHAPVVEQEAGYRLNKLPAHPLKMCKILCNIYYYV